MSIGFHLSWLTFLGSHQPAEDPFGVVHIPFPIHHPSRKYPLISRLIPRIVLLYLVIPSLFLTIKNPLSFIMILRSEERRVGKSVDLGGRRIIKKKKKKKNSDN